MKRTVNLSAVTSALAIAVALAFSGQAQADQVTANYTGMSNTENISLSVVLPPGTNEPATPVSTKTGIFNFKDASGPINFFGAGNDEFVSFCIDLEDTISGSPTNPQNHTWDVVTLASAPDDTVGPMGALKAQDLAKLLGGAINSGVLNDARDLTAPQKQALQLAVWEVVHEDSNNDYNIASGSMRLTSDESDNLLDLVSGYLANIDNAGVTAMRGLVGLTSTTTQDYVAQVPIPAAAWLFGSAMIGAVALGRRRKDKDEAAAV